MTNAIESEELTRIGPGSVMGALMREYWLPAAKSSEVTAKGDPVRLMLFPEMDPGRDVPEITTACWGILHKSPDDVMCASARMVVKRKGESAPLTLTISLRKWALPHKCLADDEPRAVRVS